MTENRINWETKGKTIAHLISELKSFENQNLEVRLSLDSGESNLYLN